MKKLLLSLALVLSLFFVGIERLNYLSSKEVNVNNFSTLNKIEIYIEYILMNCLGYPLYPEIAKEAMLMLDPTIRGKRVEFNSDFFLQSKVITEAIENYKKPTKLYWHPSNYLVGSPEARVSLTFNGGTLHIEDGFANVVVPCSWPKYSNYRDLTYTTPLANLPEIRVQEGLFWVLQQEGWIHPYTAIWKAALPTT